MDKQKKTFPLYLTKEERQEIERRKDASGFPSLNSYIVAVATGKIKN
jgi:hypothetical protein